ncbi:unnamed protein product [Echinostoma caproni]|uniref:Uncharacterized protein n=1 Tax=Echinostoma caproni TaxID=27848 RepID=A0A3P8LAH9_9TREM|nr:unnamed protein product [Echinostoma caproni]
MDCEPESLTTAELEQSVRLSEFRLQTNLAALVKIQNKEDHVKEWLKSTNEAVSRGEYTPSEGPLSPQVDTVCSFTESSGPCSPTLNSIMEQKMETNATVTNSTGA